MAIIKKHFYTGAWLLACCGVLLATSACRDYTDDLTSVGKRVERLEADTTLLHKQDSTINALYVLAQAVEINDYVISVVENADSSYTIVFKNKGTVTLHKGQKGSSGIEHVFGVKRYNDGLYYWTIDGHWLLDSHGNMVRISAMDGQNGDDATVMFPTLINDNGVWKLWDAKNGTWQTLGQADGENGKPDDILGVRQEGNTLYVITSNGILTFEILL